MKTFFFFWSSPSFWQKKKQSNLSEDLFFFGNHNEIHWKTLVCEEEDKVRLNFGPRNFWNSKFGPRLKKVGRPCSIVKLFLFKKKEFQLT